MVLKALYWIGLTNLNDGEVKELEQAVALKPQLRSVLLIASLGLVLVATVVVIGVRSAAHGLASVSVLEEKIPTLEARASAVRKELRQIPPKRGEDPLVVQYDRAVDHLEDLRSALRTVAVSGGGLFPGSPKVAKLAELMERSKTLEREIGEIEVKAKAQH